MRAHTTASSNRPQWFSIWVIMGAAVIGFSLLCIMLAVLWATRRSAPAPVQATAVFNVIYVPTVTLSPVSPTANPTEATAAPSTLAAPITIGAYVQVTGTGGDGLRLRNEPSLGSPVRLIGSEAEVFRVVDGPREVDGFTWWYLVGPFDESRNGWAAENYLVVVQNP
jgi:hypothetical protein